MARAEARPPPSVDWTSARAEAGELGQALEAEDGLLAAAGHDPRRIAADLVLGAEIGAGGDAAGVAFDVWQETGGGPEPGLLLPARGSPEGAVHHRARRREVTSQRFLIAGTGRLRAGGEDAGADHDRREGSGAPEGDEARRSHP